MFGNWKSVAEILTQLLISAMISKYHDECLGKIYINNYNQVQAVLDLKQLV